MKVSILADYVHYVYLKTASYESNGGIGCGKNMIDFLHKVTKYEAIIAQRYGKPDIVSGCSVHPLAWIAAHKIARKYKIRFVAEVRDFWPRIWVVSGDKKAIEPMVLFFGVIQRWTFHHADRIIYSMYHEDKYICGELEVPKSEVYLIGQPMDCDQFDMNSKKQIYYR